MGTDRWHDTRIDNEHNGLRFFAQLSEELLYYFSHDSFKVPTLNFHFLCIECLSILEKIDEGILDKGNIIPVLHELVYSYKQDAIIHNFYGEDINVIFSAKDATGEYKQTLKEIMQSPTTDSSLQKIKKVLSFFQDDLARESRYLSECINQIKSLILKTNCDYSDLDKLQNLTKILLTELINCGYSQEYIYSTVRDVFYNNETPISNAEESYNRFISHFPMQEKKYVVYLPLNNVKIKNELSNFRGFDIAENVFEMFEVPSAYVIKFVHKAMDPEHAKNLSITLVEFCLSLSQYCQHNKKSCSFKVAEVVDTETNEIFKLKALAQPINRQIRIPLEARKLLMTCFEMTSGVFNAVSLHASAFETKEPKNQLLNLWTAIEVLIPIERNGSYSRINQISNSVSTILSSRYFRSLLYQLDQQIFDAIDSKYDEIINSIEIGNSRVEKLLALLTLSENQTILAQLCSELTCAPLITFRMQQYKNHFSSGSTIKQFYKRHSKRLTWQIMRIYRNRNMIVHNGDTFPFLEVILQNLHFYIDEIIDVFCDMNDEGFVDASSVIMYLSQKEQKYLSRIEAVSALTKDNYISCILEN